MNITASPMPVTLAGVECQITPLSDKASHAITQWVRSDLMATAYLARQTMEKRSDVSIVVEQQFSETIIQAAMQVEWMDANGSQILKTKIGLARLLMESLRPTVNGITENKALSMLATPEDRDAFWSVFLAVNDMEALNEDDVTNQKKSDHELDQGKIGNAQPSLGVKGDSSESARSTNDNADCAN